MYHMYRMIGIQVHTYFDTKPDNLSDMYYMIDSSSHM